MTLSVVAGNPTAGPRTPGPAQALADPVAVLGDEVTTTDPAEHVAETFAWPSVHRHPAPGLQDVCVVPLTTGADGAHVMAPEVRLRPLLVALGAPTPTRGFPVETPLMDRAHETTGARVPAHAAGPRHIRATARPKAGTP
ncbi:hypothetical protein [Streptomyces sp. NPDC005890]|uniref:hypothetical protein n=1 Tax=Streptomyces sp. NPDC005890 TaxID=3154568 RepID=UPI0033C2DEC1